MAENVGKETSGNTECHKTRLGGEIREIITINQRNLARFVPHLSHLEGAVRGNVHRPPCHDEHSRHLASFRVSLIREAQKQFRSGHEQTSSGGKGGSRVSGGSCIQPFEMGHLKSKRTFDIWPALSV